MSSTSNNNTIIATFDLVWSYQLLIGKIINSFLIRLDLPNGNSERTLEVFRRNNAKYFRSMILSIITDNDPRLSNASFKNFRICLNHSFMDDIEAYDNFLSLRGNFYNGRPCQEIPGNNLSCYRGEMIYSVNQNTDRVYCVNKSDYSSPPISIRIQAIPPPPSTRPPNRMVSTGVQHTPTRLNTETQTQNQTLTQTPQGFLFPEEAVSIKSNSNEPNNQVTIDISLKCWNCGKVGHIYTNCPNK